MTLSDKITTLHTQLIQRQKAQEVRALLQNLRMVAINTNINIQNIVDSGSFETLDVDIKTVLLAAWNVSKDTVTGFENATIAELLDWRG